MDFYDTWYDYDDPCASSTRCDVCFKEFDSEKDLNQHRNRAHYEKIRCRCPQCGRKFYHPRFLKIHISLTHNKKPKDFECYLCDKKFESMKLLKSHIAKDHEENPKSSKCYICDKVLKTVTGLKNHMLRVHSEKQENSICNFCQKEIQNLTGLKQHMRLVHTNHERNDDVTIVKSVKAQIPVKCRLCDKTFPNETALNIHLTHYHNCLTHDMKFSCYICDRNFKSEKT